MGKREKQKRIKTWIKNGDKENKYTYGAICNCGNAKKYEGWTIADIQHRTDFYTPYASELGLI